MAIVILLCVEREGGWVLFNTPCDVPGKCKGGFWGGGYFTVLPTVSSVWTGKTIGFWEVLDAKIGGFWAFGKTIVDCNDATWAGWLLLTGEQ